MTIELNKTETFGILSALEDAAENNLKLIKEDCNNEIYASEIYVQDYLKYMDLIRRFNKVLKEENKKCEKEKPSTSR